MLYKIPMIVNSPKFGWKVYAESSMLRIREVVMLGCRAIVPSRFRGIFSL